MNRDLISVTVTLGLFGGGVGLIIGSFIDTYLQNKEEEVDPNDVYNEPIDVYDESIDVYDESILEDYEMNERDDEELQALVDEFDVTNLQLQLYHSGTITLEELRSALVKPTDERKEKIEKGTNYTIYSRTAEEDKQLLVEERYHIWLDKLSEWGNVEEGYKNKEGIRSRNLLWAHNTGEFRRRMANSGSVIPLTDQDPLWKDLDFQNLLIERVEEAHPIKVMAFDRKLDTLYKVERVTDARAMYEKIELERKEKKRNGHTEEE